jgi:hypothetical protein
MTSTFTPYTRFPYTSYKRSYSTFNPESSILTPNKKPVNAFSLMMTPGRNPGDLLPSGTIDFTDCLDGFHQALMEADRRCVGPHGEEDFAVTMTQIILNLIKDKIMPRVGNGANMQTKVNALHLLMDIAMGIAYGPPGTATDMLRAGTAPPSIITTMYDILSDLKENEKTRLSREDAFLEKVKKLRCGPRQDSALPVWKGLDEVLRLLDFPGIVDFRFCYDAVQMLLSDKRYASGTYVNTGSIITRILRNDIRKLHDLQAAFSDQGKCPECSGGYWNCTFKRSCMG